MGNVAVINDERPHERVPKYLTARRDIADFNKLYAVGLVSASGVVACAGMSLTSYFTWQKSNAAEFYLQSDTQNAGLINVIARVRKTRFMPNEGGVASAVKVRSCCG